VTALVIMSSTQFFLNIEEIMMNMQKMNVKKAQQGFTLIELMIVVAIIGILASIAIPSYRDYVEKAKASKALAGLSQEKSSLVEAYSLANAADADALLVAIDYTAEGITATLTPTADSDGVITWECTTTASVNAQPKGCSVGGSGS